MTMQVATLCYKLRYLNLRGCHLITDVRYYEVPQICQDQNMNLPSNPIILQILRETSVAYIQSLPLAPHAASRPDLEGE